MTNKVPLMIMPMLVGLSLGQDWSHVPLWADFGLYGPLGWQNLDYRLGFIMDHYDIISLEKCLFETANERPTATEGKFQKLTSQMRSLRPESKSKILFYWATDRVFACYQSVADFQNMPDMWLRDVEGYPVLINDLPFFDFRIKESADLWINGALGPVKDSQGMSQGVFLDGLSLMSLADCHIKTCGEDKKSCCIFSKDEEEDYNGARGAAVLSLRNQLHEIDPENVLYGNGIFNYDFYAGLGNRVLEFYLDKIDGLCMEHLMAFEDVDRKAVEEPYIKLIGLENLIQQRNILVQSNITLLVRGYPGPLGAPINIIGGLSSPHLPPGHPYPQPEDNLQIQQAMKDLLPFPLAVFLCAFADPNVYFTYSMWLIHHSPACLPRDYPAVARVQTKHYVYLHLTPKV